jgi:wyosine [tRNA(Phe)-imidazoG37] synthetase (radical SAM superfamily)
MFLHKSLVYGPLKSRRLGTSLGVNLLPVKRKVCNFECVYCECGWTESSIKDPLPTVSQVTNELESRLHEASDSGQKIDHITFAGNGEPTLHPDFPEIVDHTIRLRNVYCPRARIAVLSNAVRARHEDVFHALQRADDAILKLDAGTETMFRLIDMPEKDVTLDQITDALRRFHGDVIIQSLFLRGHFNGQTINNTTALETDALIARLKTIGPRKVMIYTIDRQTPAEDLERVSPQLLSDIAGKMTAARIPAEYYS